VLLEEHLGQVQRILYSKKSETEEEDEQLEVVSGAVSIIGYV
jgi:hypothetical protein